MTAILPVRRADGDRCCDDPMARSIGPLSEPADGNRQRRPAAQFHFNFRPAGAVSGEYLGVQLKPQPGGDAGTGNQVAVIRIA
jgi:hypothetical protein